MDAAALKSASGSWCTEIAGGAEAPCLARELLTSQLGESMPEATMHDLHLLATELVTNAVLHAHVGATDTLEMRVAATPNLVQVSVTDPGHVASSPELQELDPSVPGGMGLFLVEQISSAWGVELTPEGANRVWFEVAA
jgi:anti-sigma regulatory factor (Ser/Thr protein kinase)